MSSEQLQFAPFCSNLDAGFWHQLSQNKLEVYGLDETPKTIFGFYFNGDHPGLPSRMCLEHTAFQSVPQTPARCLTSVGQLINTNTVDKFREYDKKDTLNQAAQQIWNDIRVGRSVEDPTCLSRFILLTFADLKKYHFYYWFAFPCLTLPEPAVVTSPPEKIGTRLTETQANNLLISYDKIQSQGNYIGYFAVYISDDVVQVHHLCDVDGLLRQSGKVLFGFCDPCTLETNPGWPLRNFLALISNKWGNQLKQIEVLCLRDRTKDGIREINHSLILTLVISSMADGVECPKSVGWEKNERGKLGPRMVNLSANMDPTRLAASAVDLNLKLMRWRLIPDLDLEKISSMKCLLLGAGTLGCNVARCLMGWGVKTITFVDNGKVSYSNPVRQTLFVFEDCLNGGKPKAEAAAESLKKICPGINASAISMSIPMPGHSVSESNKEDIQRDVERLEGLIDEHDVIFLLMDTRESRWLPTMLGAAKKKVVMNAALGFDTFLVLRHGLKVDKGEHQVEMTTDMMSSIITGDQLGCYFCNDVVAPGNSTKDRTLDQQCTVSRPGMSFLASALVVELLVSVMQHPEGGSAPADTSARDGHLTQELTCSLGLIPHQIRGFLSRFHTVLPGCRAFDKCTACSKVVLDEYRSKGFEFLLKTFDDPSYLEDLTGLTAMHLETLDAEVWDLSDDESIGSMES